MIKAAPCPVSLRSACAVLPSPRFARLARRTAYWKAWRRGRLAQLALLGSRRHSAATLRPSLTNLQAMDAKQRGRQILQ
jgi:hypothetical protein